MKERIKYVSDTFLDQFKVDFEEEYLELYKLGNKKEIERIFSNPQNVIETDTFFDFKPLISNNTADSTVTIENIKSIWSSLSFLAPVEAESEKLWVAMESTYYLDYHLKQLAELGPQRKDTSIMSRTIFNNGQKRSLFINNISILWWIAYYLIDDDNSNDKFHLVEYFVNNSYRGNAVAFFSSNFVANKKLALGVVEAIKELTEEHKMIENRYSYSNANKILNQVGGVRMLDLLTRDEAKAIIKNNLLDTEHIRVLKKAI
ncbi:DUF6339 family protein [Levilactobacillus andaensis]|uniref:DUF6339 family protein n=1 Tax=Levilactobacillus andaensis TaxID=2799570 RepID=UPI001943A8FD|nr:DUF6339 family protein [Levilactobacillus andaensis]